MTVKVSSVDVHFAGFAGLYFKENADFVEFHHRGVVEVGNYREKTSEFTAGVKGAIFSFSVPSGALSLDELRAFLRSAQASLEKGGIKPQGRFEFMLYLIEGRDDVAYVAVRDVWTGPASHA
ncbi:MAG: hypothetical protein ACREVL_14570 [Solimonas sp.]